MSKKKVLPPGVRERDGRYTYRYSVPVIVNGKKTRKQKETPSFKTPKEAYLAGIQIEAKRLEGKTIDEKTITLGQWIELWLEDYKIEREPAKGTVRSRENGLKCLKKYLGEHTKLKEISSYDYQSYLNKLKKDDFAQGTIKLYHSAASFMFRDAKKKKIILNDPTEEASLPVFKSTLEEIESGVVKIPKFLEKKQLQHLLQYIRFRGKPQEYAVFLTLAYTGLRIGELLALKVSDFDEEEKTISVKKNLYVDGSVKNYVLGPPKNDSSVRTVTIGESVIKAIKGQLAWRESKINNGELQHDADFIFWSLRFPGYPACYSRYQKRFEKILKDCGLPDNLTPHSLRHTHVSLLAEAKEELAVIQERLGHKNDEITRTIYLHVTEQQRKLVPDRFEQVMNS
jgi:integrase